MMDQQAVMETILDFWRSSDAFKQSIASRSEKMNYTFYDGPPFTSGDPHYGHLLQSIVKDMVPRRMTMRGYRVARKRGRDCHGIPAENFVNKQLGITSRKQVEEEFGIGNYIEACRSMVNNVNDAWKRFVDHVGRRVDMDNAYFTMDNDFMESVINVFSDLYDRNLIYKGFKVLGYSRALGTALSNSEIAEGYEMRQDPAVTVKMTLQNQESRIKNQEHKKSTGIVTPIQPSDGAIEVVVGVIRDEKGRFLMLYDNRIGVRYFPGGKIEEGELPVEALKRERQEELGVQVVTEKFLGHAKTIHYGTLFRLHYFEVTIDGEPVNKEPTKHGMMEWIEKVSSDNELGYVLKFDQTIITDQEQLVHDFVDFALLEQGLIGKSGTGEAPIHLLAWTTTPWTLPSNMFAAVNQEITYVQVYDPKEAAYFVLAEAAVEKYRKDPNEYILVGKFKGRELLGLKYTPLFDYYYRHPGIADSYKQQVHTVLHAPFVTVETGTGVAHEAPAFGEDDYNLVCTVFPREKAQERLFDPVNAYGEFTDLVPEFAGQNIIDANPEVIKALKARGVLAKHETINHSYPHCPRTGTPLIYKAIESRFVKEDDLKKETVPAATAIHFVPEGVQQRFIHTLETAPDRNISRTRFWGCPLPVRESTDGSVRKVVGSIDEIYQLNRPTKQLTKIILVRHGRTDYNEGAVIDTWPSDKAQLNEMGKQQAELLAQQLHDVQIDAVYTSPMTRCKETLVPLLAAKKLKAHEDVRLRDVDNFGYQDKRFDCSTITREGGPVDGAQGETIQETAARLEKVYQEILRNHPGQTVVICTHGDPSGLLRKHMRNAEYTTAKKKLYIKNKRADEAPMVTEYVRSEDGKGLDLHRPYIDQVTLIDPVTGKELHRISEVLDCWFESGSMPYGQDHFMSMRKGGNEEVRKGEKVILVDAGKGIISCDDAYSIESYELNKDLAEYLAGLSNKKIVVTNASGEKRKKMEMLLEGYDFDFFSLERNPSKEDPAYFTTLLKKYTLSSDQVICFDHDLLVVENAKKVGITTIFHSADIDATMQRITRTLGTFSNCADFIAEGLDQTRGWFRALHVLGHAYHGQNVFRNVAVTGMILAEDGKKMSKRLKNYPDPSYLINQYGADALRLYLLGSPVVRAEPLRFSEKAVEQTLKDTIIPLQNVFNFFSMYAEVDKRQHPGTQVRFMRHAAKQSYNGQLTRDSENQSDFPPEKRLSRSPDLSGGGGVAGGFIASQHMTSDGNEGEDERDKQLPLSEKGVEQLTSATFIEQVIRIDPEVIICSDFLRTQQTAEGVQKVMQEYLGRGAEVIITPDRGFGMDQDNTDDIYKQLLETYTGKRVLIVSHKKRFRYLRNWIFGLGMDMEASDMREKFFVEPAQAIQLPITQITNELDKRILSELHATMQQLDGELQSYYLESATKTLTGFIDKLTNWYLRRSRRRFRDEEMTDDKQQAYGTLYEVIRLYLLICAPFIPFTTEDIRQKLQAFVQGQPGTHPSIHLQAWPVSSQQYVDRELMEEIATVRKIIKGALYLRAKHQIKVKQPLQKLEFRI